MQEGCFPGNKWQPKAMDFDRRRMFSLKYIALACCNAFNTALSPGSAPYKIFQVRWWWHHLQQRAAAPLPIKVRPEA